VGNVAQEKASSVEEFDLSKTNEAWSGDTETMWTPWSAAGCNKPAARRADRAAEVV